MAVFPDEPGLTVVIMVDGKPLQEYVPDDIDHPKELRLLRGINQSLDSTIDESVSRIKYMVRYIEATSNKRFTFRLDKKAGFPRNCHHLGVKWEVDNFNTNIRHEPIDALNLDAHWTAECCRVGTGTAEESLFWQYFSFGDLKTIENDEFTRAELDEFTKEARNLGVLRVFVYRMQESTCSSAQKDFNPPWSIKKIPEKALAGRALTHSVQYKKEKITTGPPILPADVFQHPQKLPYAIFEFRYRSREGLIQECIIPRTSRLSNMDEGEIGLLAPRMTGTKQQLPLTVLMSQTHVANENDLPTAHRRRHSAETHGGPSLKRFKEIRRIDGRVVVDLDSEEDIDVFCGSATALRNPEARMIEDNVVVDLDSDEENESLFVQQSPDRRMRCETVEDEDNDFSHSHRANRPAGEDEKSDITGGNHSAIRSCADTAVDPKSKNNIRSPDRRARCETVDEGSPHRTDVLRYKSHEKTNNNMDRALDDSGSDSDATLQ